MSTRDQWVKDSAFIFGPGFKEFDRFFVGFEEHFHHLNQLALDVSKNTSGYPPYNITKIDDTHYTISLAVAGFTDNDITVEYAENKLTVTGRQEPTNDEQPEFVYQGIAGRDFTRTFGLNDEVVVNGAILKNGILNINLERIIPEAKKARKIAINNVEESPKLSSTLLVEDSK